MNIEAKTEPAEDGHGYASVVKRDGKVIYNSESAHAAKGVFEHVHDAQAHATAYADAIAAMPSKIDALKAERQAKLPGAILELNRDAAHDYQIAAKLSKAAKVASSNAEKREARVPCLAQHTDEPRVRVEWDKRTPAGVTLVVEGSDWDHPFEPEEFDLDDAQLSLPGTDWTVQQRDGQIAHAVGYGRCSIEIAGDSIKITLGKDEHVITAKLDGKVVHKGVLSAGPATAKSKGVKPKIGELKEKELRERIALVERAETLLGLYALELERKKPRKRVIEALTNAAAEHGDMRLVIDMGALDDQRGTQIEPDRAAAALLTIAGVPELQLLEQLVPDCGDVSVLDGLLDDELDRSDDTRDPIVIALRQRLAELAPMVQGEDEPDDDDRDDEPDNVTPIGARA